MIFWEEYGIWPYAIALAMCGYLALAALRSQRLDFSRGWKMAAIWTALIALVTILFSWIGM